MKAWSLYLIRNRRGALYTGITTDVQRRFSEHSSGGGNGAKYLRSGGPLQLVYQSKIGTRALAQKAEHAVKKLTKQKKESLVLKNPEGPALLAMLGLPFSR